MKYTKHISIIALIVFSFYTFSYAYAVDNNCRITIWDILQIRTTLGCIEERLDALENQVITDQTTASNLGSGTGIFASEVGNDLQFKSLIGGNNTVIQSNSTTITIHSSGSGGNTTASNTDNTVDSDIIPVFKNHTGNTLYFRVFNNTLNDGITIFYNDTYIWLFNTAKEDTVCSNSGSGIALCNGGNVNINSLIAGERMYISNTGGDLTITNAELGQLLTHVRQQLTKTNLPNTYTDIYTTSFSEEEIAGGNTQISFTNSTKFRIYWSWDFVGAGTDRVRWVDTDNNANVLFESSTFAGNCDPCDSGWLPLPSWITSLGGARDTAMEWQGLSSNGTNDPIAYGYVIYVK